MINYLKILDLVFEDQVAQMCWSILNDLSVQATCSIVLIDFQPSLLTPLYAIHPPHTLAVACILLTIRLLRIPLPAEWYLLFDVEWDDIWSCCGTAMRLWDDWGLFKQNGTTGSLKKDSVESRMKREDRWRRAWILAESRKAVRRWVDESERDEGRAQGTMDR